MTTTLLIVLVGLLLALPQRIAGVRLGAVSEAGMWLASMLLRAALSIFVLALALATIAGTDAFLMLTNWCAHVAIPGITQHLGIEGRNVGHLALAIPGLALVAAVVVAMRATYLAARRLQAWLHDDVIGPGPDGSLIVTGREVIVAAVGFLRPRTVVSTGALVRLDEHELNASLAHERGHIVRAHRFLLLAARMLLGLSTILPGGRSLFARLRLSLEKDADNFAARQTGSPEALARAISKARTPMFCTSQAAVPAVASLNGSEVDERLAALSEHYAPNRLRMLIALTSIAAALAVSSALLARTPSMLADSAHPLPTEISQSHYEIP